MRQDQPTIKLFLNKSVVTKLSSINSKNLGGKPHAKVTDETKSCVMCTSSPTEPEGCETALTRSMTC